MAANDQVLQWRAAPAKRNIGHMKADALKARDDFRLHSPRPMGKKHVARRQLLQLFNDEIARGFDQVPLSRKRGSPPSKRRRVPGLYGANNVASCHATFPRGALR